MATRYWVLGSGTWDTTTTTNWSTTSGGAGGASAPTSADNVIFDANSNVGTTAFTVTIPGAANCLSFSTGGAGGALDAVMTLSLSSISNLNVYGSLTLPATNFTWTGASSGLTFLSSTTGNTITTNGVTLVSTVINWNNVNGGWTLGSALTNTTNTCQLLAGSLNTGNYNVSLAQITISGALARTLTLGSSTVTLSGAAPWTCSGSNLTLNAGTSTINCSGATATFTGGGLTYYNVGFTSTALSAVIITGANTFNNLTIAARAGSGLGTLTFDAAVTNTITGTLTLGSGTTAVNRLQVIASTAGSPATLSVATLAAITDIDFRDITASGASAPWSGTRIGNCLGCTNITFATPRTVYWNSAASANWSGAVWSTTSGNTGGLAINFPLAQDTVVIDNAGLTAGNTITWGANWNFGAIDFSSRTNLMTFGGGTVVVSIYGSLTLSSAVTLTGTGVFTFRNQGLTATIISAGVPFTQPITIQAVSGTVAINGNLTLPTTACTLTSGTLDLTNGGTGNYTLSTTALQSSFSTTRSITFGTGNITVTGNSSTVLSVNTLTGFSYTGTPTVNLTYSGSTGTRTIIHGGIGATEANVLDIYISAGSDIITTTAICTFGTLSFAGFIGTFTRSVLGISNYRDLVFGTGMTYTGTSGAFNMIGTVVPQTLTGNGVVIDSPFYVTSVSGAVNLGSALTLGSTYGTFSHTSGSLIANYNLTCLTFTSSNANTRSITFGGNFISLTGTGTVWNTTTTTGLTLLPSTSTISLTDNSTTARTFAGGSLTYNNLNIGGATGTSTLTVTGNNNFNIISSTKTVAHTILFTSASTTTIKNWLISGSVGNLVTISSTTAAQHNLVKTGTSDVSVDYLNISYSNAS